MIPYLIAGAIGFVVAKIFDEDEEPKYADGGSVLLAPNGKPSNLTPEQYKLVREPAFKKWFGDWENDPENSSKVVDENGEPLVVYHGSNVEFNTFDKRKIGFNTSNALRGFYFTDNSSVAYSYTYDENEDDYYGDVIEVFLSANKMKIIDAENKDWVEFSETAYIDKEIKKAFESGYDSVMIKNIADSFIDMNNGTDYYGNNFVVDNPNQIKLADGSNTTFDGNNPDIRFDGGGNVSELNNYLHNIRLDEYYMENEIMDDDVRIEQYKANFGRNGNITYRIYPDEKGNVFSSIYVSSIDRGTLDYGIVQSIEGKKDSRGEGAKAIASLFLLYPNINSVHYEDESYFDNESKSFWEKIGGSSSELLRSDFFTYFENKFGYNPDIRYAKGGEIKDLVVLHNINDYQIEEANKIGGLITPSIAIVKSGNSFTDFGSITLIGTKELIDPENRSVKVFAGDVYSPSVPRKLYYVDNRLLEKLTNELIKKAYRYDEVISKSNREIYNLVQQHIGDYSDFEKDLNTIGGYELNNYYFDKLKLVYIVDKGIKIKVPMKEKRHFLWNNVEFTLTPEQKKRFAPILKEYTTESNEKGSSGVSKEIESRVYDLFLEVLNNVKLENEKYKNKENGDVFYKIMNDGLDESFEKYVGTRYDWSGHTEYKISRAVYGEQILDTEKLNQNIKKIFTKDVIEDYKKWLSDFISQFQGRAYFLKGNEKMSYNLENLVDATSNRVVGQEKNITFGVNQAKSFGTKRLNSINEIKKNSNKLISKEEMSFIDDKNKEVFFKLSESLKYEYSDTWGKLDSLGRALADYFKGNSIVSALRKNDFKNPSSYQIDLFKDFADELKNSPVDYFEAKYQRAVSLREFKYAVVPKETSKEVIQILSENGLIIKKYQSTDERIEIVNNISNKDKSIKFDNGGEITTYTEFYDNLQIEDGSKYIGKKFRDVFLFLGRKKTPNDFRILLKQYYGIVKRMEEDNYSTKAMKQTDLNKLKSSKLNIDKKKYLANFYLDGQGIIVKFVK